MKVNSSRIILVSVIGFYALMIFSRLQWVAGSEAIRIILLALSMGLVSIALLVENRNGLSLSFNARWRVSAFLLLASVFILSSLVASSGLISALKIIIGLVAVICVIMVIESLAQRGVFIGGKIVSLLLAAQFLNLLVAFIEVKVPLDGAFSTKNMLGGFSLICILWCVTLRSFSRGSFLLVSMSLVLLLLSGARGSQLALVFFLSSLIILNVFPLRLTSFAVFLALVSLIMTVHIFYIGGDGGLNDAYMSSEFASADGRNMYSGRQLLWPVMFDELRDKPLLGAGAGVRAGELLGLGGDSESWSSHNQFLETAVHSGTIGLTIFVAILMSFWRKKASCINRYRWAVAISLISAASIHGTFEVALINNNLTLGVLWWSLLVTNEVLDRPDHTIFTTKERSHGVKRAEVTTLL